MTPKSAALLWGLVFIAVGILGFVDNPIVGTSEGAIFHADTLHNSIHLASGALFLLFAIAAPGSVAGFLKIFGIIYLLIGVLGMITAGGEGGGKILGILHVNSNDNYLHIGLGVLIFLSGYLGRRPAVA